MDGPFHNPKRLQLLNVPQQHRIHAIAAALIQSQMYQTQRPRIRQRPIRVLTRHGQSAARYRAFSELSIPNPQSERPLLGLHVDSLLLLVEPR